LDTTRHSLAAIFATAKENVICYNTASMHPRKPTTDEKKQLLDFFLRDEDPELFDAGKVNPIHRDEIEDAIENAAIAVFDNYITDSVGYAGKVMVVVWPTSPEYTQTYTWLTSGGKEYLAQEIIRPVR
jgi:hypothetical protein